MYDIRQFRPILYLVLLLGLVGYALAMESGAYMVLGLGTILLNFWLTRNDNQRPLPRFMVTSVALFAGLWSILGLVRQTMVPLMAISQWLFVLLLLIMWQKRNNRVSCQMLVMSLVLMVAGAINSASLFFGLILIAYLFLALYCWLLFHLKVETETAISAYSLPPERLNPQILRHDQTHFVRSMRRLTILVSSVAIRMAVLVFLFFPRSSTPGLLMPMPPAAAVPLTGFSERVSFEQVARITQNPDVVARVTIEKNGRPISLGDLYLRGLTLDVYTGSLPTHPGLNWQWVRNPALANDSHLMHAEAGIRRPLDSASSSPIKQTILLRPSGTATLFSLAVAEAIRFDRDIEIQYTPWDNSLKLVAPPQSDFKYEVYSSDQLAPTTRPAATFPVRRHRRRFLGFDVTPPEFELPVKSQIAPRIASLALNPEVSGKNANGPLATQRVATTQPGSLDGEIARNIARYLQRNYHYTLDLSDTSRPPEQDPLEAFLYDYHRGHCEYFAGAMTLLCQSLGLEARMVIGFRASNEDYNAVAGYYIIRQSHAHAWVEVLTPEGWQTFDPTAADWDATHKAKSIWNKAGDILDFLQYKWATSIVTYSNETRLNIIQNIDRVINGSFFSMTSLINAIRDYFESESGYVLSWKLLAAAIAIALILLPICIAGFLLEKWRLNRRARRIGIASLPPTDKLRLARQLGFYDDLLRLLARHNIHRPAHQTPQEFAQSLSFLPADTYEQIRRLTRIFYHVRFGAIQITGSQRRHLATIINRIAETLASPEGMAR